MKWNLSRSVAVLAILVATSAYCERVPAQVQTNKLVKVKSVQPKKMTAKTPKAPKPAPKKKNGSFDERTAVLEQRVDDILWRCDLMAYSPFDHSILFPYE